MSSKRRSTRTATRKRRHLARTTASSHSGAALKQHRPWKVHCTVESTALKISPQTIRAIVGNTLRHISSEIVPQHICEVHVMVINDARMREINFEFRRKDKPTDVLSFPQYTPHEIRGVTTPRNSAGTYLGDLVISSETTIRQAKHFGVTVRAELTRLIIHGILHLIGYDHEGVLPREAQAMRRRERALREVVE